MSKSNFFEDVVLNLLRGVAPAVPGAVYVALYTTAPGEAGGGVEVTGGSYARVVVTFAAPSGGAVQNSADVIYPTPTAGWGTVVAAGLCDAASGGNLLYSGNLAASKTINTGDDVRFVAGALVVAED